MVLESIFRGEFSLDQFSCPKDPEYKKLRQQVDLLSAEIKDKLGPEGSELLEDLLNQIYSAQYMESESCFKAGFAAGCAVSKEVTEQLACLQDL